MPSWPNFFSGVAPTAAHLHALAFAAGFAVRPSSARSSSGRIGGLVGRKYTFLITIAFMGLRYLTISLLPFLRQCRHHRAIILIVLRADPGSWPGRGHMAGRRSVAPSMPARASAVSYTAWIQTTATLGLFAGPCPPRARHPHLWARTPSWPGARIPFLLSIILLFISLWIRLQLNESPMFLKMKEEGRGSKAPLTEAFATWSNAKIAILALLGATAGEAVVWYGGQFYALFFLTQTLKVAPTTASIMIAIGLALGTPFFIDLGWLSDKIGRKPIMAGFRWRRHLFRSSRASPTCQSRAGSRPPRHQCGLGRSGECSFSSTRWARRNSPPPACRRRLSSSPSTTPTVAAPAGADQDRRSVSPMPDFDKAVAMPSSTWLSRERTRRRSRHDRRSA